jgi:signal peptidase I
VVRAGARANGNLPLRASAKQTEGSVSRNQSEAGRGEKSGSDGARGNKGRSDAKQAAKRRGAGQSAPQTDPAPLLRRVWDQIGPIAIAVLIALAIRAVIIESYYVPSGSMLPTMFIGDHVFVSKFTFGAHIPFTSWKVRAVRDPKRGEIVVFALGRNPDGSICPLDQCSGAASEGFVKRIVGLPGDTVEYKDGKLFLNGKVALARDLDEVFTDERGVRHRGLDEDLDGCHHRVLDIPGQPGLTRSRIAIPDDRYFLMGDNRDNSNDSRAWGTVHRDDLKGPVLINYWSWNNSESWLAMLNPLTWIDLLWNEMYWGRIGMTYDCDSAGDAAAAPPAEPEVEQTPTKR